LIQKNKYEILWFHHRIESRFLTWKFRTLTWKSSLRGWGHNLGACSFSRDFQMFLPHWKRRSWPIMLIFEVRGTFMCLLSLLGTFNLFSFVLEEKLLILNVFLLVRESLMWGQVFHLGVILFLLRNDSFFSVEIPFHLGARLGRSLGRGPLKMKGAWVYL